MIAGLETVNGGEIRIGGERVDTLPPGRAGSPWCSSTTRSTRT